MNQLLQSTAGARAQSGVALLECLMALLIFSVGLLGLLGLEARVMNISTNSENRNRAALFAGELASQMWLSGTVTPDTPVTASTPAYLALEAKVSDQTQGGLPGGAVAVVPVTANSADITVTWQEVSDPPGNPSRLTTRVVLP